MWFEKGYGVWGHGTVPGKGFDASFVDPDGFWRNDAPSLGVVVEKRFKRGVSLLAGAHLGAQGGLPNTTSTFGDGYGVVEANFDLKKIWNIPIHVKIDAMDWHRDEDMLFDFKTEDPSDEDFSPSRKVVSGVVDIMPTDRFGFTLQVNRRFNSIDYGFINNHGLDNLSFALIGKDFVGTGINYGLGTTTDIQNLANFDADNFIGWSFRKRAIGGYLLFPPMEYIPGVLLALQQTFENGFKSENQKGAGLTLSIPWVYKDFPIKGVMEISLLWDKRFLKSSEIANGALTGENKIGPSEIAFSLYETYHF